MGKRIFLLLIITAGLLFAAPVFAQGAEKPYEVSVNLTQNIVTVYGQDEKGEYTVPEKAFYCSVGEETPEGVFQTSDKYVWRPLFGNVYGQYATRITGHILFHSVPYLEEDKSTLEYEEYNKLGETASMGCIRLSVADVKWLYDNCPKGTTVRMYYSDEKEPLTPDEPVRLDENDIRRGWDPTDPDENNPWHNDGVTVSMRMDSGNAVGKTEVYYKDFGYSIGAQDGQLFFGRLGITLVLPENIEGDGDEGRAEILYKREKYSVGYYKYKGKIFYKLRELADITGTEISWDQADGRIALKRAAADVTSAALCRQSAPLYAAAEKITLTVE